MPEPLEEGFERATAAARVNRLWIEGLIAIGLFNIFVLLDYYIRRHIATGFRSRSGCAW